MSGLASRLAQEFIKADELEGSCGSVHRRPDRARRKCGSVIDSVCVSNLMCYQRYRDNEEITLEDSLGTATQRDTCLLQCYRQRTTQGTREPSDERGLEITEGEHSFYFEGSIEASIPPCASSRAKWRS
jgi:hypothetical protein